MLKYHLKKVQYGAGFSRINAMILRTLFTFEPLSVYYDASTDGIKKDNQPLLLDPADPQVYVTECKWPEPLPTDTLVKLNELMAKMQLGLESKTGALSELGEQFPDEKLQELFEEQVADLKMDAAKQIIMAQVQAAIVAITGIVPEGAEVADGASTTETESTKADGTKTKQTKTETPGVQGPGGLPSIQGLGKLGQMAQAADMQAITDLVTQAWGTKLPQRRIVDKNENDGISQ
jgi:hypothetical protein